MCVRVICTGATHKQRTFVRRYYDGEAAGFICCADGWALDLTLWPARLYLLTIVYCSKATQKKNTHFHKHNKIVEFCAHNYKSTHICYMMAAGCVYM